VLPESEVGAADTGDSVERPQGRVSGARVGQAVLRRHFVQVGLSLEPKATATHVGQLHQGVAEELPLDRQVPLPVVGVPFRQLQGPAGRPVGGGCAPDFGRGVERARERGDA
jgi:hypothetical protein